MSGSFDVVVGDNVTIKSGVQLWDGIRIENNVFLGPAVVTKDVPAGAVVIGNPAKIVREI